MLGIYAYELNTQTLLGTGGCGGGGWWWLSSRGIRGWKEINGGDEVEGEAVVRV